MAVHLGSVAGWCGWGSAGVAIGSNTVDVEKVEKVEVEVLHHPLSLAREKGGVSNFL